MGLLDGIIDWLACTFFGMCKTPSGTQTKQSGSGSGASNTGTGTLSNGGTATQTGAAAQPTASGMTQAVQLKWDMYHVVCEKNAIDPRQVKDISVSGDGAWILVRLADGSEKRFPSEATPEVLAQGERIYRIKVDTTMFQVIPGKPLQNPTVLDLDGYPNTGYGQKAGDGVYYDSFLDWTKQKFGNSGDPLGLVGYRNRANAMTDNIAPPATWQVVYEKVGSATTTTVAGQTYDASITGQNGTITGVPVIKSQRTYIDGNYTVTEITYTDGKVVTSKVENPVAKTIYSGGTAYNTKPPAVKCEPDANGNMQCHPI